MNWKPGQMAIVVLAAAAGSMGAPRVGLAQVNKVGEKNERPNVVVIVADDLGWNGVGYHNGFARTKNIDRLARQGVELDRFYVCPMCSPTRAGLLTGRYALHVGMGRSVVHPWTMGGLPAEERTLAEALGEAGYKNRAIFGKWHLGHMDVKFHPLSNGFTQFTGCYTGAIDYYTRQRVGEIDWHENFSDIDGKGYATDEIADESAAFITAHARDGEPFFCYTAFTAPHEPLEAPQIYLDRYKELDDDPNDGKPSAKQSMAAMTECLDDGIGRILSAIERGGIANKTLIWFLSDNGGIKDIPGNNWPLKGAKFSVYEGGVRVPAAVSWPGHIEGGRKIEQRLLNVDVMPTVLGICHVPAKSPAGDLDGSDVSAVLMGTSESPADRDVYLFTGQGGLEKEQIGVISGDGWKLVVTGPDVRRPGGIAGSGHEVELYRVSEDPAEEHDLAETEPGKVKELGEKVVAFRKSEPKPVVVPMNKKPEGFKPPVRWHNGPAAEGK